MGARAMRLAEVIVFFFTIDQRDSECGRCRSSVVLTRLGIVRSREESARSSSSRRRRLKRKTPDCGGARQAWGRLAPRVISSARPGRTSPRPSYASGTR